MASVVIDKDWVIARAKKSLALIRKWRGQDYKRAMRRETLRIAKWNLRWRRWTFGLVKALSRKELTIRATKKLACGPNRFITTKNFILMSYGKSEYFLSRLLLLEKLPVDRVTLESDEYKRLVWED